HFQELFLHPGASFVGCLECGDCSPLWLWFFSRGTQENQSGGDSPHSKVHRKQECNRVPWTRWPLPGRPRNGNCKNENGSRRPSRPEDISCRPLTSPSPAAEVGPPRPWRPAVCRC